MRLYYYTKELNFGDHFNEWMWQRLLPGCFDRADDGVVMTVIGTTIESGVPQEKAIIVFGSGTSYTPPRQFPSEHWHCVAVRGYLTARLLGLPESAVAADAAFVLPSFEEAQPIPESERKGVIFIPHHSSTKTQKWAEVCQRAGIEYVDSHIESIPGLEKIRHARLVLTEAMHGAIVSDLVRVPWVPLVGSLQINTFKWLDWLSTINVPFEPRWVPETTPEAWLLNKLLPVWLGDYYLPTTDVEEVFKLTERRQRQLASRTRNRVNRVFQLAYKHIGHVALKLWQLLGLSRAWEERQLNAAAEVLKQAAQHSGYLSQDDVVNARVQMLMARLPEVRRIYEHYRTNS